MAKPTQEEIDAEIKRLEAVKLLVPEQDVFGGNNWETIEAQIRVLRENVTVEEIYQQYEDNIEAMSTILDTRYWLDGKVDFSPAVEWEETFGE